MNFLESRSVYTFDKYKAPVQEWKNNKWDWNKIFQKEWIKLKRLYSSLGVKGEIIYERYSKLLEHFKQAAMAHTTTENFMYESPAEFRTISDADIYYISINPLKN